MNGLGVASNNFAIITIDVARHPRSRPHQCPGKRHRGLLGSGNGPLGQQTYVTQGATAVGMLKLGFWTDAFQGAVHQIRVQRSGTGNDFDISGVKIYQDANGNGTLEPTIDTWISSAITSTFVTRSRPSRLSQNLIVTPDHELYLYHL